MTAVAGTECQTAQAAYDLEEYWIGAGGLSSSGLGAHPSSRRHSGARDHQIVNASKYASPLYREFSSGTTVGYVEDFRGWLVGQPDSSVNYELSATDDKLTLSGSFPSAATPTSVSVFKSVGIDITTHPILEAQLNAASAVSYGLRFIGQIVGFYTLVYFWVSVYPI